MVSPSIPNTNRDTSATAIAAASLLKLAALIPNRATAYRQAAETAIERLAVHYLTPVSPMDLRQPGILTAGCFNKRNGVAMENELIWGDYFLFESLLALAGTYLGGQLFSGQKPNRLAPGPDKVIARRAAQYIRKGEVSIFGFGASSDAGHP